MALASFCLWIKVSANPAFGFANQFGKKRKACQYVTCIGTMLFFDGAGTVGSGETALEAACAGCHKCIYIVRMRSRLEVAVV